MAPNPFVPRSYYRDNLVACRAQLNGADAPTVEETDQHVQDIQAFAKQALAGASAAMVFTSSMEVAVAYPIFAQQNYANPREYTGKIVCANCHLASKPLEVRLPQAVLPDTIFKMEVEVPAKYAKRRQPNADGSKGPMNIGAIAVMPDGWKLAPKDRLPKVLKKEMKGLAWAPYSKERHEHWFVTHKGSARAPRLVFAAFAMPDRTTRTSWLLARFQATATCPIAASSAWLL